MNLFMTLFPTLFPCLTLPLSYSLHLSFDHIWCLFKWKLVRLLFRLETCWPKQFSSRFCSNSSRGKAAQQLHIDWLQNVRQTFSQQQHATSVTVDNSNISHSSSHSNSNSLSNNNNIDWAIVFRALRFSTMAFSSFAPNNGNTLSRFRAAADEAN